MTRTFVAVNSAPDSENRMHGDEARAYGFRGGLVPGIDVFGYLAHEAVDEWGAGWLGAGRLTGTLRSPVYDGDTVVVERRPVAAALEAEVRGDDGSVRADATLARLAGDEAGQAARHEVMESATRDRAPWAPGIPPADRPAASRATLAAGVVLGSMETGFHADMAQPYLDQLREDHPAFRAEDCAHPAWILILANWVLAASVELGPWIHVGSDAWFLAPVRDGDRVEVRSVVTGSYERKGHEFVDYRVWYFVDAEPVALVDQRAIWQPRRVGERNGTE